MGNSPLHFALVYHNYTIADLLIRNGARENIQNKMGYTPWQCVNSLVSGTK